MEVDNSKSICHIQITPAETMPRVWRGAVAAHNEGYKVFVIGYGNSTDYSGIEYKGFSVPSSRLERVLYTSKKMIRCAAESDARIVELHAPELLLYCKTLKKAGKKVVFNCHEFYALQIMRREYIPRHLRGMVAFIYRLFERYVCKKIDCIIYPCTVNGQNPFESYKCQSIKIENYSAVEKIDPSNKEERTAIYAGSLSEDRGCTAMVEAFNEIDGKLYLAGNFSSEKYKEYILSIANPEKIEYLGSLSREELFEYYSRTSVGMNLLMGVGQYDAVDNLSTKIYEYMCCGMPVVSSDLRYARLVNSEYEFAIIIDPKKKNDIIDAVDSLFSDCELTKRLGQNGIRAVKEKFNWEIESQKLLSLYNSLSL